MNTDAITKMLESSLASVVDRRARLARHVEHRDQPLPADFAEQAVELEDDETMSALAAQLAAEESALRGALERVGHGTYGRCQVCGLSIDDKRLMALPATATCIMCASAS